jgi:hypothetical protein
MRAVTVYRVDYGRKTKDPIGVVFEMREKERIGNYNDLLRLARRLFAFDTADAVHITVDAAQARRAPPSGAEQGRFGRAASMQE